MESRRIAVVGAGVAGLTAAWLLRERHDVVLFERNDYIGGHTHTIGVATPQGEVFLDTGFVVHNDRNYPQLEAMFDWLGIETQPSGMSFSVSVAGGRLEYAGSGINTLFGQRRNLVNPAFWSLINDILRFNKAAKRALLDDARSLTTLGSWLEQGGYRRGFRDHYLLPMGAAIWSCPPEKMLAFPAASFLRFFENHGLLDLRDRPQWRTVVGGSHNYVRRMRADLGPAVRSSTPVKRVSRLDAAVHIETAQGERESFDDVVLACHADEALRLLSEPSTDENELLGAFSYQHNRAVLHTDSTLMPKRRRVWSSWNYLSDGSTGQAAGLSVTYWMNALQNLHSSTQFFVSLNPLHEPDPTRIVATMDYEHPVYDAAALKAQKQLQRIQGRDGLWHCGSYFGNGFHEDALCSALEVASAFEVKAPWVSQQPGARNQQPPGARNSIS